MRSENTSVKVAYQLASSPGLLFRASHFIAYKKLGIGYSYIPKNACTSLKLGLGSAEGFLDSEDYPHSTPLRVRSYSTLTQRRPRFRFTVLRNPIGRAVSGFLEKLVTVQDWMSYQPAMGIIPKPTRLAATSPDDITFELFVEYLERSPAWRLNDHFRPQSDFLLHEPYTHVGKFEDLDATWDILECLGVKRPPRRNSWTPSGRTCDEPMHRVPVGVLRQVWRKENRLPSIEDLAVPDLRTRLGNVFRVDCDAYALLTRN